MAVSLVCRTDLCDTQVADSYMDLCAIFFTVIGYGFLEERLSLILLTLDLRLIPSPPLRLRKRNLEHEGSFMWPYYTLSALTNNTAVICWEPRSHPDVAQQIFRTATLHPSPCTLPLTRVRCNLLRLTGNKVLVDIFLRLYCKWTVRMWCLTVSNILRHFSHGTF